MTYWEAFELGSYYSWAARRQSTLPGGNPLTGQPRDECARRHWEHREHMFAEARVARIAMAKYYFGVARERRALGLY